MAIRWRKTGELLCAAKSKEMKGDIYINDHLHYQLSVVQKVLVPDKNEAKNGLHHWLHGEARTYFKGSSKGVFITTNK